MASTSSANIKCATFHAALNVCISLLQYMTHLCCPLCCRQTAMTPDTLKDLEENEGFTFNTLRGTANFFSADALQDFLTRNHLSHVIRAHEVQQVGFQVIVYCNLSDVINQQWPEITVTVEPAMTGRPCCGAKVA